MEFEIFVPGRPAPQGSKRGFYNKQTKRVHMVESSDKVKPWRQAVTHAVLEADIGEVVGALSVELYFLLPRPKSHYGTGRNVSKLKPSSPDFPAVRPDLDKLVRSTLDGLDDGGLFEDDSRVVRIRAEKWYAKSPLTGCRIRVFNV
jgi:Holliday junction resolvase RusA-like endonuclease